MESFSAPVVRGPSIVLGEHLGRKKLEAKLDVAGDHVYGKVAAKGEPVRNVEGKN